MKAGGKSFDFGAVNAIRQMIRPYCKWFTLSFAASIVLVFTQLAQARLTQALIDNISAGRIEKFILATVGFFAMIGTTALLNYFRQVFVVKLSSNAVRDLKNSVSEALLNADYSALSGEHAGNAMSTINQDIAAVGKFLNTDLTNILSQFSMAIGTFIYMLCLEPTLALITFAYLPFGVWIMFLTNRKIAPYFTLIADASGKSLSIVEQVLSQVPVIKSFRMERQVTEKIYQGYRCVYQAQKKAISWGMLMPFWEQQHYRFQESPTLAWAAPWSSTVCLPLALSFP